MSETMSPAGFELFDLRAMAERNAQLADSPMAQHALRVQREEVREEREEVERRAMRAQEREAMAYALAQAGRLPTLDSLFAESLAARSDGDPAELQRQAEAAERRASRMAYFATHQGSTLEQILARASAVSDAQADAADARLRAERAAQRAQLAHAAQQRQWAREREEAAAQRGRGLLGNPAAQIGLQSALAGALAGRR